MKFKIYFISVEKVRYSEFDGNILKNNNKRSIICKASIRYIDPIRFVRLIYRVGQ